jgi:hypothetical protein
MPLAKPNAAPETHVAPENFPVAPFEIPDDLGPEPDFIGSASLDSFDAVPMPNAQFKPIEQILVDQRAFQASQPPGAVQQSLQAAAVQPVWTGGANSDSGSLEDDVFSETEEEEEEEQEEEEEEEEEDEEYNEEDDDEENYSELLQGVGFYRDGQVFPL